MEQRFPGQGSTLRADSHTQRKLRLTRRVGPRLFVRRGDIDGGSVRIDSAHGHYCPLNSRSQSRRWPHGVEIEGTHGSARTADLHEERHAWTREDQDAHEAPGFGAVLPRLSVEVLDLERIEVDLVESSDVDPSNLLGIGSDSARERESRACPDGRASRPNHHAPPLGRMHPPRTPP